MSRKVYRFQEFTLIPDEEPDAEPAEFAFQCAVCDKAGPTEESPDEASRWPFEHLKAEPEHYTYRQVCIFPCRLQPGAVQ